MLVIIQVQYNYPRSREMASISKTILIGHLGKDPEMRFTPGGKAVTQFSMATSEKWTDTNGEKKTETEWHTIVCWGKLAENCAKFLSKGRMVYIDGKIKSREYDGKDGSKRRAYEIIARDVQILSPMNGNGTGAAKDEEDFKAGNGGVALPDTSFADDVPF
jgi:single-strand DNA-binding protein